MRFLLDFCFLNIGIYALHMFPVVLITGHTKTNRIFFSVIFFFTVFSIFLNLLPFAAELPAHIDPVSVLCSYFKK
uniref:Uncharacterized protein n=1 Tax=Ixodes ricinus TaxID=34613 RepID=A0A147BLF5_IXORI